MLAQFRDKLDTLLVNVRKIYFISQPLHIFNILEF